MAEPRTRQRRGWWNANGRARLETESAMEREREGWCLFLDVCERVSVSCVERAAREVTPETAYTGVPCARASRRQRPGDCVLCAEAYSTLQPLLRAS